MLAPARQRGGPHEHAGYRHAAPAGQRRSDGRRGPRRWPCSSTRRTSGGRRRRPRSWRPRRRIVQTDPDVGARSVLVVAGEGWHRGVIGIVASKLVEAFHRPAIVLSVDGRRRARILPEHPALRHAGRARAVRSADDPVRRAPAGRRSDDRGGADPRPARRRQRRRRRDAGSGGSDAAPADRRRPRVPGHHGRRCGRRRVAGAVWRRQPAPGVRRAQGRDRRRPPQAEGPAPQDGAAGRTAASSGPSPGGRPSATTTSPSTGARSTSPSRWIRTSTMARHSSS